MVSVVQRGGDDGALHHGGHEGWLAGNLPRRMTCSFWVRYRSSRSSGWGAFLRYCLWAGGDVDLRYCLWVGSGIRRALPAWHSPVTFRPTPRPRTTYSPFKYVTHARAQGMTTYVAQACPMGTLLHSWLS